MNEPQNIRQVFERAARHDPNKVYLIFQDQKITYFQMDHYTNQTANMFIGEMLLRGSNPDNRRRGFMSGYYKDPDATMKAWRNEWFHTGDYVQRDIEGRYYFVDRKKDIVRRSGENISASEVEGAIRLHPAVLDVAVIPVPDLIREQEVKAYVVLKEGYSKDNVQLSDLIAWTVDQLAYFKVPRYWEFRECLPVTQTGKIQKLLLKMEKENLTVGSFDRVENNWVSLCTPILLVT